MKKVIVLIAACIFSLSAMAQDYQNDKTQKQNQANVKYCAKLKDGKMIVMQNDKDLTVDVKLANGTIVKTDGTIMKSDGTQTMLKNGECADNSGNVINPKSTDKLQEEKSSPKIVAHLNSPQAAYNRNYSVTCCLVNQNRILTN